MELTSEVFQNNETLPVKYTMDGEKISPPLGWNHIPQGTKSFALIMDDLDVPPAFGGKFTHWMVYDIPANSRGLKEGDSPNGYVSGRELANDYVKFGMPALSRYGPPWPPTPNHRYRFTLHALKVEFLVIAPDATEEQFRAAILADSVESAELVGIYGPAITPQSGG